VSSTAPDHPNRAAMDALFRRDAFADRLGLELADWGCGWADVAFVPTAGHHNFMDMVHGAALFAAGDVAFSVACNSWGRHAVALSVDVQFLAAPPAGTGLVARARERSRTRRTGAYLIEVLADDRLVASLHAMAHRRSTWHLGGEDAWPEAWRQHH
jgi:acyl-CoA thioesterase